MVRFLFAIASLLIFACQTGENKVLNKKLANRLADMGELDQSVASAPTAEFKDKPWSTWEAYRNSIFESNCLRLNDILSVHGYPGYDLVGEKGELDFWSLVQHCDFDPEFQQRVLKAMLPEIKKGNANSRHFGLLFDRIRINKGKPQRYGTQVRYNAKGQAYPKILEDSLHVDKRRKELGFEPLVKYLNKMTKSHYRMNRESLLSRGVKKPMLYPVNPS